LILENYICLKTRDCRCKSEKPKEDKNQRIILIREPKNIASGNTVVVVAGGSCSAEGFKFVLYQGSEREICEAAKTLVLKIKQTADKALLEMTE